MRRTSAVVAAAVALAVALPAAAAPPDEATKAAAREIALEGLALYDSGKYQEALERFVRADAMVHAPTMLLMAGRALMKLGRLIEAADKLAAASQVILDAQASDAFRKAVLEARKEREALLLRIPLIVLTVDAPDGAPVTVTIDGDPVPQTVLGQKRLIEPGAHTFEARAAGVVTTARVDLKEGESRAVHLSLQTTPSGALKTAGWVTMGAGAAAAVVGAITAGLAVAKNDELVKAGCRDGHCPPSVPKGDLDDFETVKAISGPALLGGLLAIAGGATMVILAPRPKPAETGVSLSPWVGFGSAGLRGTF